ncbi:DNA repair exonuclease [Candidatus Pacearchaeota archaeon]|nr:DNA repair exonuclease [Candidatus Pacearchaeota archaeon]
MVKFAHIADCHLGGWRQPELQELNMQTFRKAIDICINEKVDFILFAGDLFDSAFPPIETLKETFAEFKKIKEAGIKSFLIAGSHDYSVSGKTFLDVLEKAGFCEICKYEESEEETLLKPSKYQAIHIYGYPGKKSGLEIHKIKKIKINEPYENNFRILMLHTTITEAINDNIPIESVSLSELPKADYYALGHIHIDFELDVNGKKAIYGGPLFPNNFKELEELKYGSFYIVEINGFLKTTKKEIKLKEPILIDVKINDAIQGTKKIIEELSKRDLNDKIVLLKVYGEIIEGKTSDINFGEIQEFIEKSRAFSFLKNTSKLEMEKKELQFELQKSDKEKIEEILVKNYKKENPSYFNECILPLMEALGMEKQEDEKSASFESRLLSELSKILKVDMNN